MKVKYVILFLLLIFYIPFPLKGENWSYYKQITITNFSSDYQKKIVVHYGTGTDNFNNVYLNSHCKTDFSDVRFRASDMTTDLKYWIESCTAGDSAIFWVKLPSSTQNIYIFYGNPTATSQSSGSDTFIFFDDCETGSPSSKWTQNGSYGSLEYSTAHYKNGSKSLKITQNNVLNSYIVYTNFSADIFVVDFWAYQGATNNYVEIALLESGASKFRGLWDIDGKVDYYSGTFISTGYAYVSNWQYHELICTTSNDRIDWKMGGTLIKDNAQITNWATMSQLRIFVGSKDYNSDYAYYDDIIIRKYASVEPTFTFGTEQQTNQPPNTPTNSLPASGTTGIVLNPYLEWSPYSDPDSDPQQSTEVRIDEHSDMLSPEWEKNSGTGNSTTVNSGNGTFKNNLSGKTELAENTLYYWSVRVQDSKGAWSNWSATTSFTTGIFSPSTSNISPSSGATNVILNPVLEWSYSDPNSDPLQNCKVWVDNNADFSSPEWRTGDAGGGAITSVAVNTGNGIFGGSCTGMTQLTQNTLFYFRSQVQDNTGRWSTYSISTTFTTGTVPSAPTSCVATYISDSQIDLSWIDNSNNEDGFKVYRSVDSGTFTIFTTVPSNTIGTNDTSVSQDHSYQYRVFSYNTIGLSNFCETSTICTSPLPPSNVLATKEGSTVILTWQDNSQVTDVHLIERKVGTNEWTYLDSSSNGTFQEPYQDAWQNSTIIYRVRSQYCGPRYSSYVESNSITTNHSPIPEFTFWGAGGTSVNFDASLSVDEDGDPLIFTWNFGDGTQGEGMIITHDYFTGGDWEVILTIWDGKTQAQVNHVVSLTISSDLKPGGIPPESKETLPENRIEQTKENILSILKEIIADPFKLMILILIIVVIVMLLKK